MGRHAGLEALTVILINGNSFYFGVLHWEDYATLKLKMCTELFDLKGYEIFTENGPCHF